MKRGQIGDMFGWQGVRRDWSCGEGRRAASQKMARAGGAAGMAVVEVTGGRAGVEKRGIQEPHWLIFCLTLICMVISRKPLTINLECRDGQG